MSSVHELLSEINLPKMVHVKQRFDAEQILDVEEMIQEKFTQHEVQNDIRKNMKIAIAVGSRGIDRIHLIVKAVVSQLKRYGAQPFVVPAMGSHGGATAEGQIEILKYLGVEEETVGCPIVSSMSVTQVGKLDNGLLVWMDKAASEADGIVVINRIKPHSAFSGDYESGLVKMISVGLGKQKGAESCHTLGFQYMTKSIVEMANVCLRKKPILFGVAIIENAYDKVKDIIIVPSKNIIDLEKNCY